MGLYIMKKNIIILLLFACAISCKAQIYPLRTYSDIPANAYIKDIDNELLPFEGVWKGAWDNKTIVVYFKRVKAYFNHLENKPYYIDVLKGKFIVFDPTGNILFDNSMVADADAKIEGSRFFSIPYKRYSLNYYDPDICGLSGHILINFTDLTNTKLNWQFSDTTDIITSSCPFYNSNPFPEPLPKEIVLTKQ